MIFAIGFILVIISIVVGELMKITRLSSHLVNKPTDWIFIGPFWIGILFMLLSLVMLMRIYLP